MWLFIFQAQWKAMSTKISNSGENWGWDADDWLCWDVITEVGDNVRKLCLTLLMVKWTIGKLTSPGVSLSTINRSYTMLKLFLFFTPYKGKVWSSFHTPLERYLSRNPTPKDCDVWWKFATFWTLNYPSDIFNCLLRKFETDAMLIWCSIQGVYFEIEAEKYPLK